MIVSLCHFIVVSFFWCGISCCSLILRLNQLPHIAFMFTLLININFQVSLKALKPFAAFTEHFCSKSFAILVTYREAIFLSLQVCVISHTHRTHVLPVPELGKRLHVMHILFHICVYQEAAVRCEKQFSASLEDRDDLLKRLLNWAFEGFQPNGPNALKPSDNKNGKNNRLRAWIDSVRTVWPRW